MNETLPQFDLKFAAERVRFLCWPCRDSADDRILERFELRNLEAKRIIKCSYCGLRAGIAVILK